MSGNKAPSENAMPSEDNEEKKHGHSSMSFFSKVFFTNILEKDLGAKLQVLNYETSLASVPGENFGSCFHTITVLVKSECNLTKTGRAYVSPPDENGVYQIHLVAKTMPNSKAFCDIFNSKVTFQKESDFYALLAPAYESLCRKEGVEPAQIFPHCLHYELDKEGKDAIIILENLKIQGYAIEEREKGVSLAHANMVLCGIAWLHALSIALKFREPEVYNKLAPKVAKTFWEGQDREKVLYPLMAPALTQMMDAVKKLPNVTEEIMEKVRKMLKNEVALSLLPNPPREPFAAISHLDLWTNNIMFKSENGKHETEKITCHPSCVQGSYPSQMKLVDFQMTAIRSPVHDVIFFLYTSVPKNIRSNHFDELLDLYCNEFKQALEKLGCSNLTKSITSEWFNSEIIDNGPAIFTHTMILLTVAYADKPEKHVFSMSEEELFAKGSLSATSNTYFLEAQSLVHDFISNNWI